MLASSVILATQWPWEIWWHRGSQLMEPVPLPPAPDPLEPCSLSRAKAEVPERIVEGVDFKSSGTFPRPGCPWLPLSSAGILLCGVQHGDNGGDRSV